VKHFHGERVLIKLGGSALQEPQVVRQIAEDIALLRNVGIELILVHGGGPRITKELALHGIQSEFVEGQRVTKPEAMAVVEMVLAGSVNKEIVRTLNEWGVPAFGLSGVDGKLLQCKIARPELGLVGEIKHVDPSWIDAILQHQSGVPVIAPIGFGPEGQALNINADMAAAQIAAAMGIKKLIFLTDQDGIWNAEKKVVSELDAGELQGMIEGKVVEGGMLIKARAILLALDQGVTTVHVLNAKRPRAIIEELYTSDGVGTVCRQRSRRNT
jgi:acetylglutamate kinase